MADDRARNTNVDFSGPTSGPCEIGNFQESTPAHSHDSEGSETRPPVRTESENPGNVGKSWGTAKGIWN